jgi:hypothetical protein
VRNLKIMRIRGSVGYSDQWLCEYNKGKIKKYIYGFSTCGPINLTFYRIKPQPFGRFAFREKKEVPIGKGIQILWAAGVRRYR